MCGIWGKIGNSTSTAEQMKRYYEAFWSTKHRGPNRSSMTVLDEAVEVMIGFHRLSVMDVSSKGDQPFVREDTESGRTIYAVCNGELYNHRELVKQYNLSVHSGSDCEMLPELYLKVGFKKMVQLLQGSEFGLMVVDVDHSDGSVTVFLGRDPAGVRPIFYGFDETSLGVSSELKGLIWTDESGVHSLYENVIQFPPGSYGRFDFDAEGRMTQMVEPYWSFPTKPTLFDLEQALATVRKTLTDAVVSRLEADIDLGFLLSGGLDSSLVCAIAAQHLAKIGKKIHTFSIGMPGGTDEKYARMVAEYIGSIHTHFELSEQDFLDAVPEVIKCCESFDVTTIRATTGQWLACKKVAEESTVKVLLIGDGSDELCSGYLYFHYAPSALHAHMENIRLVSEIHFYDGLRADRGICAHGLEARVPFLDSNFIDTYLQIDPELRKPREGMEKWLLRKSFTGYLPEQVLWRRKEAFSDGVSSVKRSWHQILQTELTERYEDMDLGKYDTYDHISIPSTGAAEAYHFLETFVLHYGKTHLDIIPRYWRHNWVDTEEASARDLDIYDIKDPEKETLHDVTE